MRINKKVIELMHEGFSLETLRKMSDKNVDFLHRKLMSEQMQTPVVNIPKTNVQAIQAAKGKKQVFATYENKEKNGEMIEGKKKGKNAWAICTAQLKKEFGTSEKSEWTKAQKNKYEKCVMDVKGESKKDMKEANMIDSFIENELLKMVESYMRPKITKRDLLKQISEQAPDTKPVVKPANPKIKPSRRDNPFQNPNPKINPMPKADTTTKPVVKPANPKIKPSRKDNPFQNPRPGVKTAPKAIAPNKAKDAIINNIMQLLNFEG
jgi:hypothetical protein